LIFSIFRIKSYLPFINPLNYTTLMRTYILLDGLDFSRVFSSFYNCSELLMILATYLQKIFLRFSHLNNLFEWFLYYINLPSSNGTRGYTIPTCFTPCITMEGSIRGKAEVHFHNDMPLNLTLTLTHFLLCIFWGIITHH